MNARQKRLFEESRKKNPNLKLPEPSAQPLELTDDDLALLKQGVGDKTPRLTASQPSAPGETPSEPSIYIGAIVTYFEDKGFGFIRPEQGGKDVFFHVSRLVEGQASDLVPRAKVAFELGMDRTGKLAASSVRVVPPEA